MYLSRQSPADPNHPFDFTAFNTWMLSSEGQAMKNDPIIVYCATATRSNYASNNLTAAGFTKVYDMSIAYPGYKAGYLSWNAYVGVVKSVTWYAIDRAPNAPWVGAPCNITVTAKDPSSTTVSYNGTVNLSCNDTSAILPSTLQLTNGTGSFFVFFGKNGPQNVSISELSNPSIKGDTTPSVIATHFEVDAQPKTTTVGSPITITVAAVCVANTTITSFGTQGHGANVNFASTDSQAVFPSTVQWNNGIIEFTVTMRTPGTQTITLTDQEFGAITGTSPQITVNNNPTTPPTVTPSPTPSPTVTPTPTPSPSTSSSPSPTPTITPTPTPTATPTPSPTPTTSPSPTTQPTTTPTTNPTPTPTPTSSPSPTIDTTTEPTPTSIHSTTQPTSNSGTNSSSQLSSEQLMQLAAIALAVAVASGIFALAYIKKNKL